MTQLFFDSDREKKFNTLKQQCVVYPTSFSRTHRTLDIQKAYAHLKAGDKTSDSVRVAGRIMALRNNGLFMDLQDGAGRVQLFSHKDNLDEKTLSLLKNFDLGDWIGATGLVRKTPRGEITVDVTELTFLAKTFYPLPDKHHGLADPETRYRMRYIDFAVTQEAKETILARTKIISHIRRTLEERGFLEVETPMLHPIAGGALAKPFVTHHNALHTDLYLRIAPELYLKRMIVGGFEKIFELNRCFRNEGLSPRHNPEFTSLETYEAFVDYQAPMKLAEELMEAAVKKLHGNTEVSYGQHKLQFKTPWPRHTMASLVAQKTGIDFMILETDAKAHEAAKKLGKPQPQHYGWGRILAALFEEFVEGTLIQPTHVTGFPKEISPLAKGDPTDPRLAERFESYANGWEIANGFSELNDPEEQHKRFEEQLQDAARGDDEAHAMDHDYIKALGYGLPPTGGLGIGIDRFVMLCTNNTSIREVLAFPTLRPKIR